MLAIIYKKQRYLINKYFAEELLHLAGPNKAHLIIYEDIEDMSILKKFKLIILRDILEDVFDYCVNNNINVLNQKIYLKGINKERTFNYCLEKNIPYAKSYVLDSNQIDKIDTFPCVIKGIYGHGGTEVFLAESRLDLDKIKGKIISEKIIIQETLDFHKDLRVYIVAGKIVLALLRESKADFRANFSLGGSVSYPSLTKEQINFVLQAEVENIDFAAIDLLFKGDKIYLNEIEAIVGIRNLYANKKEDLILAPLKRLIEKKLNY